MQLKEILELLKVTPMHYNILITVSFLLAVIALITMLASMTEEMKFRISVISLAIFLFAGLSVLTYSQSSSKDAIKEAKISRSGDKIHIESNSEFMKSADLDVVAEKDGYIYIEFENKTYRIEDLSKKGN